MRLNAATDSAKRSGSDNVPLARSSASTDGYCAASVSTPTCCQFLAALRTIAGPPMSMFSTASASVQAAWATVASNGYRLTTSRSMVAIPCSFRAAICPGRSRQASRPAGTLGCSVLTRPSSISGHCVSSGTSVTGRPWPASSLAVPPGDNSPMPSACRACANSTMPVLSETDRSAFMRLDEIRWWEFERSGCRVTDHLSVCAGHRSASRRCIACQYRSVWAARSLRHLIRDATPALARTRPNAAVVFASVFPSRLRVGRGEGGAVSEQLVLGQLLAQGVAVQAKPLGGARLVVSGLGHHHLQQRFFDHAHQHPVDAIGLRAAQVAKVALQSLAHALFYVFLAHAAKSSGSSRAAAMALGTGSRSIRCPRASRWPPPACHCAPQSCSVLICCLNASPPGSARRYPAICLRALRTPIGSPYRL